MTKCEQKKKLTLKENFKKNFQDILFCVIILLYPTIQFIIFYLGVNVNTIALSFKFFDYEGGYSFAGLENFRLAFYNLFNDTGLKLAVGNSVTYRIIAIAVGMTLSLMFSYYIYLNRAMAGFFKAILFMPAVVSTLVFTIIFRKFVGDLYSEIASKITGEMVPGLLATESTKKATVFFYNVFFGFGTAVLLYSGAMSGTNESVMEYAEVDGTNYWQKFIYVLFPMIFPTFITFMVMHISDTFMNQMNLLGFFADSASPKLQTIGYFLYTKTLKASLSEYPLLATYGLIFTLITMPIVFLVKHLLEKFGPNAY